ncbi:hypothetical protein HDU97_004469 [Phlyctochytrium planicorne]|nr:hypothetical protein HDU97_004469 [Phlyctochytrium planicorne]
MSSKSRKPFLLVLDLNGTLIDRVKDVAEKEAARRNPYCPSNPDYHVNGARVYLRPFLDLFLQELVKLCEVGVWTSAMAKNSVPLVDQIFGRQGKDLAFHYDRSKCDLVKTKENPYGSIKNLRRIWADSRVNGDKFWNDNPFSENQKNTILLDDTESKSSDTPGNLLWLPTYYAGNPFVHFDRDQTLLSVLDYIKALVRAHEEKPVDDVREYMAANPLFTAEKQPAPTATLSRSDMGDFTPVTVESEYKSTMTMELYARRHRVTRMVLKEDADFLEELQKNEEDTSEEDR